MLIDYKHEPLTMSDARYRRLHAKYVKFREEHDDRKPVRYYPDARSGCRCRRTIPGRSRG